ncbi:hypothetical protein V2J09_003634 [Rumex salicifolius]
MGSYKAPGIDGFQLATFHNLLSKINLRLSGWKGKSLSKVGRVTLTKSVLSSLPVYTMNFLKLLEGVRESIDRISRSFIWSDSTSGRSLHLVAWEEMCKDKGKGGLGIWVTMDMNLAILGKLS